MGKHDEFLKGFAHLLECGADKVVPEADLAEIGTWDSMSVSRTFLSKEFIKFFGGDIAAFEQGPCVGMRVGGIDRSNKVLGQSSG